MILRKILIVGFLLLNVNGCAAVDSPQNKTAVDSQQNRVANPKKLPTSYALPGTTTAVVGIGIDKDGIPLETVKEIVLLPGQKVIFAGPDRFKVEFKNKKAPSTQLNFESQNGVVTVSVPKEILDSPRYARELKANGFVRFDYSIFVNGRELDPPLIVRREN